MHFCAVVDDFLTDPQALIDFAGDHRHSFALPTRGYPGLMLRLSNDPLQEVYRFVRHRMARLFGFLRGNARFHSALCMTTLLPRELANFQRLCHTDPRDLPGRRCVAGLVYLFTNETLGGTAFYRWKQPRLIQQALQLELQDPEAAADYLATHSSVFREAPAYITASNELAELITVVPARFNRMIFYSGEIPHSGHITAPRQLSGDCRRGRLTLNCFASVEPG